MKAFRFLTGLLIYLLLIQSAAAQNDLNAPAPIDPEIRMGKLQNGLTYLVRKNKEPEKRASFYIIQNVGAILENDDQNGLAHFLEHMAFNGTKHFPGKAIINSLEKHGVAFGRNINAYTAFDETVYNLSDVPVDAPGLVDTCLLILNDWSDFITLDEKEIDLERGVIEEEYRTSKNAQRRMIFEVIPVVLKGSRYAKRDILGDLNIIKNFKYETLRRFYNEWYRTDLQAIAVVGDINVDEVESKIKDLFSKIPPEQNPPERTYEEIPHHEETYYVLAKDKEAPSTSVSVVNLRKSAPPSEKNLAYIREDHIISLMNSMINTRISEMLQKQNPPFVSGSISYGSYIPRGYDAFSITATARKNEEEKALEGIYSEAERVRRFGFTPGELERAKARLLSNYENTWKQKDKIDNETYISGIQEYYLNGEPLTSIDFDYEFLRKVIGGITPEEVSAKFREVMSDQDRTIIIQGLDADDVKHLSKEEALAVIDQVKNSKLTAYEEADLGKSLIHEELKGSKIISTTPLPKFGAVEWTLANNVKVVYRKADYEKDNVLLSAFSFGGISKLDNDLILPANLFPSITPMYGAGDYDNITLQKMLSGKKASVSLSLTETTEGIGGSSTPKDLETMMQLLYLRFAKPRFDSLAHNSIIGRYAAQIANMEKDPNKMKNDSISLITTDHNPRTKLFTKESVAAISIGNMREIYRERFPNADEFWFFIVGNVEQDTLKPLVEKYIGSLPSTGRKETWIDRGIKQPEGKVTRKIVFPLTIPKATVFISYEKGMKYQPENYLGLAVIEGILDIVYVETVREDEGGTYGVSVNLSNRKRPEETGEAYIMFDCDPARADDLKAIIYRELDKIVKDGPDQAKLDKAVNNILKTREESKLHNSYWMSILNNYYSNGIDANDPKNYENILKSFKVRDIKKIAGKMFKKADVVDLVFTPEAK
jgi:zinc protease